MPVFESEEDYLKSIEGESASTGKPANFAIDEDYAPPKDPRLDAARRMGGGQTFIDAAAYKQRRINNSIKQAYHKLRGNDYTANQLQKLIDHEDKIYKDVLRSEHNPNRTYAAVGDIVGDIAHPLAMVTMPFGGGATIPIRMGKNALIGGTYETLTNPGGAGDRFVAGLGGVAGAAGGSLGTDVIGKSFGKWLDPKVKVLDTQLKDAGLSPRIGDLLPPDKGQAIKWGEDVIADSVRSGKFAEQVEKLKRMVIPNPGKKVRTDPLSGGVNTVSRAIGETKGALSERASVLRKPFDDYVASNTNLPNVNVTELKNSLVNLLKVDKSFFSKITDDELVPKLQGIVDGNISKLSIKEVDDIRKGMNELYPQIQAMSQVSPQSTKATSNAVAARYNDTLAAIGKDIDQWGQGAFNKKAHGLYEGYRNSWKEEILPFKESDLAYKLGEVGKFDSATTGRLLGDPKNIDESGMIRRYLREYGPHDNSNVADALATMRRHSESLGEGGRSASEGGTGVLSSLMHKVTGATTLPMAALSDTSAAKGLYMGDPSWLIPPRVIGKELGDDIPESIAKILRTSLTGGYGVGLGRETGEEQVGALAIIKQFMKNDDFDEKSQDAQNQYLLRHPSAEH